MEEKNNVEFRFELCAVRLIITSSFRISWSSPLERRLFSKKIKKKTLRYTAFSVPFDVFWNSKCGCKVAVLHLLLN